MSLENFGTWSYYSYNLMVGMILYVYFRLFDIGQNLEFNFCNYLNFGIFMLKKRYFRFR